MQDLALEESAADDPPEAFPPGFFSEKLTNLRRLPEPTKEGNPATTEPAAEDNQQSEQPESVEEEGGDEEVVNAAEIETTETDADAPNPAPAEGTVYAFSPLKPFPAAKPEGEANPALPHHEWASAMFHQPVYVFAYHQPDSYGYHYYF